MYGLLFDFALKMILCTTKIKLTLLPLHLLPFTCGTGRHSSQRDSGSGRGGGGCCVGTPVTEVVENIMNAHNCKITAYTTRLFYMNGIIVGAIKHVYLYFLVHIIVLYVFVNRLQHLTTR